MISVNTNSSVIVLVLVVLVGHCSSQSCPVSNSTDSPATPGTKDHGALSGLLSSTRSTRGGIFTNELPYNAIRSEIWTVYNRSSLKISPFVEEWLKYGANALYLAGFIVFVGVVLPLVMVSLWMFWECCYEVEEDDSEECRNESRFAQFVAWTLTVGVVILLLAQFAFVVILLAGNTLVHQGVMEGSVAVSRVLPEVKSIRDSAVSEAETILLMRYESILKDAFQLLNTIPSKIESDAQDEVAALNVFYSNVRESLSHQELLLHYQFLYNITHILSGALTDFKSALSDIRTACSSLNSTSLANMPALNQTCMDLQENRFDPVVSPDLGDLGGSNATLRLGEILNNETFSTEGTIENYPAFFSNLSQDLSFHVNLTTSEYGGKNSSFYSNLTAIVDEILFINSSLSLGLPSTQEDLLVFLGPHYLVNWDDFRSTCTIVFALVILFLGVCLVVAMVRGLFNIYDLYVHGEEVSSLEGAHQSGIMIKKLSFMLAVVCVVASLSYSVSLILAGGLAQGCGPYGNFSDLLSSVIDDNRTWRGVHLLGQSVLGNGSYPLTFASLVERCRNNRSLYEALQLGNRFNFREDLNITAAERDSYVKSLEEFRVDTFDSLTPCARQQLELLNSTKSLTIAWNDFVSLTPSDLFSDSFVGIEETRVTLQNLMILTSSSPDSLPFTNLLTLSNSALSSLTNLSLYLNHSLLPSIRNSSSYLQQVLDNESSSSLLDEKPSLERELLLTISETVSVQLTRRGVNVTNIFSKFTSDTVHVLECGTGSCHSLSLLFDHFSSALCQDVVPGLDLYWASLWGVLVLTLVTMALSLVLASRFIDLRREKLSRFNLTSAVMRQTRALFWIALGLGVNTWLVVAIARDDYFHTVFCSGNGGGCCPSCVWIFGIVFILFSLVVVGVSRVYQCLILHRLSKGIKKVRRYWMDKKKAAQFHSQLAILLIQDIPFLIIAGIYTSSIGILTIPAFFSLTVSLLGICSYLVYILQERNSIISYFLCLKNTLKRSARFDVQQAEHAVGNGMTGVGVGVGGMGGANGQTGLAMNGGRLGRYVSSESEQSESDSQGTTQHADDWMFNNNAGSHGEHRLSVIPEHTEGVESVPMTTMAASPGGGSSPTSMLPRGALMVGRNGLYNGNNLRSRPQDLDFEMQPPSSSMRLDRTNSPTPSAIQHRREVAASENSGGIEVASSIRHYDTSSASNYYFGSKTSVAGSDVQGYYSSSQPPDEFYESSDNRDEYDSDYSHVHAQHHKLQLRLNELPCEMSVDV